jgi:hypothetical protein
LQITQENVKDMIPQGWGRWKKKPVVIRAVKMDKEFWIATREGVIKGNKDDYLIEGVEGELYPCDSKIFHKTYQEVI